MNHHQSIMRMVEILIKKFIEHDKSGLKLADPLQPFSFSELMVLLEISRNGPMTAQELLRVFQVDRGILGTIISHLSTQQLIEKEKDESDKRKVYLSLTEAGHSYAAQLKSIEDSALQFVMTDMTVNEQKAILKFLSRINQLTVEKYEEI